MNLGGRPSGFVPGYIQIAKVLCEKGATEGDLARAFDVNVSTIWRWKAQEPEFCNAIRAGKSEADDRVEFALYQRAVGYDHPEIKVHWDKDGELHTHEITRHVPPDPDAAFKWLRNRRPHTWREGAGEDELATPMREFMRQLAQGPRLVELNERRLLNITPEREQTNEGTEA